MMPYWSISEWRARIGSSWSVLGRPHRVKSSVRYGARILKKELTLNRVATMIIFLTMLIGVNIGVRNSVEEGHHRQLISLFEEVIQAILHKVDLLKTILIILTILMAFIYPALKHSRRKRVSCGTCDFSVSAGLLLHAMFLILKMIYPVTNPVIWLIPAAMIIHALDVRRVLTVVEIFIHKQVEIFDAKNNKKGCIIKERRKDLKILCLLKCVLDVALSVAASVIVSLLLLSGDIEQNPGPLGDLDYNSVDDDQILSEDDLINVLEAVLPIKSVYFSLGQCLRLQKADLESIRTAHPSESDAEQALSDTVKLWLQQIYEVERFGLPTWRRLVEAVDQNSSGHNHELAKEIALSHPATLAESDGHVMATQMSQHHEKGQPDREDVLTIENMREIIDLTWPHRAKWRLIGIELGIDFGTLDDIERRERRVDSCLIKLIVMWLGGKFNVSRPTRADITAAIKSLCRADLDYDSVDRTHVLGEDDLLDVKEAVLPIKSAYFALGQYLRLHPEDLDSIKVAYPSESDAEQALSDTLKLWLQQKYTMARHGRPTWRKLVEAVDRKAGGNNHELAKKIASQHPTKDTDSALATQQSQPHIKKWEREDVAESDGRAMVTQMSQHLEKGQPDREDVLTLEDLKEIIDLTQPHCAKWRLIGTKLGIDTSTLDAIDEDNDKVIDCLLGLIHVRLRSAELLTRADITDALRSLRVAGTITTDEQILHSGEVSMKPDNSCILTESNIKEVLNVTWPYRSNWKFIGNKLGIDSGALEAIEADNMRAEGTAGECLMMMILEWLRNSRPIPTWLALATIGAQVSHSSETFTKTDDFLLNLNHQEEVLEFTWPYRIAWKFIGIELGINPSQLETIEVHNRMRVEDCFVETLQRWLEYCDYKPTWFALNQALQSEPVLDTAGVKSLTKSDLRILKIALAEHLHKLEESGINLKQGDHPRITKEVVIIGLLQVGQQELSRILRQNKGVQHLQDHVYNNIYKKALQAEEHKVELQVFRMVLCGVPRSGKTTFWKQLAIKDFEPKKESTSTGAAESRYLSAIEKKNQEGSRVDTNMLFDLQLYGEDSSPDCEALTIYKQILETNKGQPSKNEDKSAPHSEDRSAPHGGDKSAPHSKDRSAPHSGNKSVPQGEDNSHPYSEDKSGPQNVMDKSAPHSRDKSVPDSTDSERLLSTDNPEDNLTESEIHTVSSAINEESTMAIKEQSDPIVMEIGKVFKELNNLLQSGENLPDIPSNVKKMCHLQDTGGQKAFLKLLPTLSVGKALYLLFFNYKDFKTITRETVQMEGSSEEVPTSTVYEQIDVIMQSLICVSTTSINSSDNVALLVGTHVDEVESKLLSEVNDIVYKRVKPFLKSALVYAESGDDKGLREKLVLKVAIENDKLCSNKPEDYVNVIMNIVDNKLKCSDSEKLPASWYMFIIILRRLQHAGYSVLQYKHCEHIAKELYIQPSSLEVLLSRLQKVFGIVLYFHEVDELKDIVICNPGFVYKSISELILKIFGNAIDTPLASKLKKWGIFKYRDLEEHHNKEIEADKKDQLELDKLIILLNHLGIIAPVQISLKTEEPAYDTDTEHEDEAKLSNCEPVQYMRNQEYLIPCVLEDASKQDLTMQIQDTQACSIVPLRIYFKCEFAPMGGFCYLFTKLISDNEGWKLLLPDQWEDKNNIYWRNKVTFDVEFSSRNYLVTLLSTDEYYEIHIVHFVSEQPFRLDRDGHSICNHVWEAVYNVLESSPNKSLQTYKTACICTSNHCPEIDQHMMKFTRNPHNTSAASKVEAWCVKKHTKVVIKDVQPSVVVWFKEPHIIVRGKFDKKVELYIRDLWLKIDTGRKSPKCQWKISGDEIEVDDEHYKCETIDRNNFKLSISRFDRKHIGEYECIILTTEEAIVQPAIVSMTIEVIAESNLQIKQHPESNARIKCGDNVTLSVLAVGAECYEWKWKAKFSTQVLHLTEISMKANDTHLSIGNLKEVLDLTSPYCAKWEFIGIELGFNQGSLDATKKNCINSGGVEDCLREMITKWLRHDKPKPTRIALNRALDSLSGRSEQKKYDNITTKSDTKYTGADGPSLTINRFSVDDQGEYSCVIRNSHEQRESSAANMALDFQIVEDPQDNLSISCGENVTLQVFAVGSEQLFYQWKKDNKDITDSKITGINRQKLTISSFGCSHQGDYTCEVNNGHKTITSSCAKLKLKRGCGILITLCGSKCTLLASIILLIAIAAVFGPHPLDIGGWQTECSFQEFKLTTNLRKINDVRNLRESVQEISDWQGLCGNLRLDVAIMEKIKNSHDKDHQMDECLKYYVNSDEGSWEEVVIAVARPPFYNKHLAKRIVRRHLHSPNNDTLLSMLKNCKTLYY